MEDKENDLIYDDYDEPVKKRRRIPLGIKILLFLLLLLIIVLLVGFLLINNQMNKINREPANTSTIPPEEEYFETDPPDEFSTAVPEKETTDPSSIAWEKETEIYYDDNIINILLIGQDRREGESRARSDSLILLSLDKNTKSIKMTSFLRDLYVQIPGYSDNRINASYAWGGAKLLDKTIEKNFGIRIDKNIEVDFTAFTNIIDEICGINISLTEKEANYLNSHGFSVSSGDTYMDGKLALAYSRIRHIDSDFYRTNRQRTVLQSIFTKIKDMNITEWYSLSNKIFPLITTDMTNSEILNYLYIAYNFKTSDIQSYRIPVDDSYSPEYIRRMSVLVPDIEKNHKYLLNVIYGL